MSQALAASGVHTPGLLPASSYHLCGAGKRCRLPEEQLEDGFGMTGFYLPYSCHLHWARMSRGLGFSIAASISEETPCLVSATVSQRPGIPVVQTGLPWEHDGLTSNTRLAAQANRATPVPGVPAAFAWLGPAALGWAAQYACYYFQDFCCGPAVASALPPLL